MATQYWPTARDFSEALQNPSIVFSSSVLKGLRPSVDHLGMPVIACGNFAAVCKMSNDADSFAIRFFIRNPGDKERRYRLIDKYLSQNNISEIAEFEYKPIEVLVTGQRYPIIQMDWITGIPLDKCVENNFSRKDALKALADEWLDLIKSLNAANVAHGDLQHGNVLHDGTGLRLVDLDGMFVPGMEGLRQCEEGHRFYQHPKRQDAHFDANLDRFSSLVIYLSLIALERNPKLWQKFHDDNLIFKRSDFIDPNSSPLFAVLRGESGEVGLVCEALLNSCLRPPSDTPSLLDLVKPKSMLPGWMRSTQEVVVPIKTREKSTTASPSSPQSGSVAEKAEPWWEKGTATHPSTAQAPAQPPAQQTSTVPTSMNINWSEILSNALTPAIGFGVVSGLVGAHFIVGWILISLGIINKNGGWDVIIVYALICYMISVLVMRKKAIEKAKKPKQTATYKPYPSTSYPPTTPSRPSTGRSVVASRIRNKYHKPNCEWARKISYRNKISFNSVAEATRAGLRPCGVCNP